MSPVPFNGLSYKKQKGLGTSDQSLFRLWNKFTKISSLVIYYLTKFYDVIIKRCSSYSKNYTWKFMQANSWHHKLFLLHFSFWIRRVCKGRGKITKSWISPEQKEIFKLNKTFFSFWRLFIGIWNSWVRKPS